MTSVRRSSRRAGHGQNDAPSTTENSSSTSAPAASTSFTVEIPLDVSEEQLLELLPDAMSLEEPSPETIAQLYRLVLELKEQGDSAVADVDEARAEYQRKEVELDQALMDYQMEKSTLTGKLEDVSGQLTKTQHEKAELCKFKCFQSHMAQMLSPFHPFSFEQ